MDNQYVQNLRYRLQKRFRRVNSSTWQLYHPRLVQFWEFLNRQPWLGLLNVLRLANPEAEDSAKEIVEKRVPLTAETELEAASIGAHVVRLCAQSDDTQVETNVASLYPNKDTDYASLQSFFTEAFVEPLYEYLDEQLDDQGVLLTLLSKYQKKAEWFQKEQLFGQFAADTRRGEKLLGLHLYEYLHDQGLTFYTEPKSASGEADMVASQEGDERLLLDAKIFDPERGKPVSYLIDGFKQVYRYCLDHNEPVGYLVIFKTTTDDLKFALDNDVSGTPFSTINGKTIVFLTVDISPSPSASKSGKMKAHVLKQSELVQVVDDSGSTGASTRD